MADRYGETMSRYYYANNFAYALLIVGLLAYFSFFISDTSKNHLEVFVYLVKLIPMSVISISGLLSRLAFTFTAQFLVLVINSLRISTQAFQAGLQLLAESIKSFIVYLLQLAMEVVNTMVSATIDLLKEAVSTSCEAFVEAGKGIAEKGKEGIEALSEVLMEVAGSLVEMVAQVVGDLWSNFIEALTSVIEKGE